MQLQPFYQLYECRYQIYFPLYSEQEWTQRRKEIEAQEKANMELEAQTVDKVFCGEQQSESDHFFRHDASWNGSDEGIHWRRTRGHFAYQLKAAGATRLLLKGFADRERFTVSIGGVLLGTYSLDRSGQAKIDLPQQQTKNGLLLEIRAEGGRQTPRISELRLCK